MCIVQPGFEIAQIKAGTRGRLCSHCEKCGPGILEEKRACHGKDLLGISRLQKVDESGLLRWILDVFSDGCRCASCGSYDGIYVLCCQPQVGPEEHSGRTTDKQLAEHGSLAARPHHGLAAKAVPELNQIGFAEHRGFQCAHRSIGSTV